VGHLLSSTRAPCRRAIITVWFEVRVLPGPPRSRMLPEIS
jgi:hypothetical protein